MMRTADLFAGAGGFTAGAALAGATPVYAANHLPFAVATHSLNHPGEHVCQDLRQADWAALPEYDVLLASPACQGHSNASQPNRRRRHSQDRATAWAVIDCAEVTAPYAILIENVPQFADWKLYPRWRACLEDLGYHVETRVLDAANFGVPQRRRRLFIAATLDRFGPLSYAPPTGVEQPFGPCIDWDADARWLRVADATDGIQARIAKGRRNHGAVFLSQHVTGHPGVSLDQSIRTVTTKAQWNVVRGSVYRPLTVLEHARAMGFADDYRWPLGASKTDCIKGLGNAVCPPVAASLVGALAHHLQLTLAAAA